MRLRAWLVAVVSASLAGGLWAQPLVVGSKKFTENVILGEIARGRLELAGLESEHRAELGGTRILWNALLRGDIDVYPEYTGTLSLEILSQAKPDEATAHETIRKLLADQGLAMTAPLGFDNTYAIGLRRETAEALDLYSLSDLAAHPELRLGLTAEFLDRADGWPGLAETYGLDHTVRGLDHDLAYRALAAGDIDGMDVYTTDAEIAYYDLVTLEDDRGYFPSYEAIYLYRSDLPTEAIEALATVAGRLDETGMRALNAAVKLERESESAVASRFLVQLTGRRPSVERDDRATRLLRYTLEHLALVAIAMALGIPLAIPLGILAYKSPRAEPWVLGAVGIIQTIPALALLVFMIPPLGIGGPPAIAALALYCLLPIVRNTHAGLAGIARSIDDSARSLALGPWQRLTWIELPLAGRSILAGIKTSVVITIGFATLGALIGAGGYGQPILTGIRLDDLGLILEGAIPAALMALGAQFLFDQLERWITPRGLTR